MMMAGMPAPPHSALLTQEDISGKHELFLKCLVLMLWLHLELRGVLLCVW